MVLVLVLVVVVLVLVLVPHNLISGQNIQQRNSQNVDFFSETMARLDLT